MMYRHEDGRTLAISQPAHAWISGQLMRRLALKLSEPLLLAGEQHVVADLGLRLGPAGSLQGHVVSSHRAGVRMGVSGLART